MCRPSQKNNNIKYAFEIRGKGAQDTQLPPLHVPVLITLDSLAFFFLASQ